MDYALRYWRIRPGGARRADWLVFWCHLRLLSFGGAGLVGWQGLSGLAGDPGCRKHGWLVGLNGRLGWLVDLKQWLQGCFTPSAGDG